MNNVFNLAGNDSKKLWNLIKEAAGINKSNKTIVSHIVDKDGTNLTEKNTLCVSLILSSLMSVQKYL